MTEENKRVEPQTLKGFQDLLPARAIVRRDVIATIETVFRNYGFAPIETPALEHLDTLLGTGGEETNKELFRLESPEREPIALRFDLTAPFARLLAQYPDKLKAPFRRYAIGPVWRADKPGPGRFREFTQLDIDAAGVEAMAADAEIIAVMCRVMEALGCRSYAVLINNRRLFDALLDHCGIHDDARRKHVLRVIDKLKKVGTENVRRELGPGRVDDSGDPIPGVGLDGGVIEAVLGFIHVRGETRSEVIERTRDLLPKTDAAEAAIAEMIELAAALHALEVTDDHARFDPSLARGLDYYTGPVFETLLLDAPEVGSVMGGGRYDRLVERFMDRPIPCTGMSVGLDRLIEGLEQVGVIAEHRTTVEVLVVTLGAVPAAETLRLASELRAAGIRTETYFGTKKGMRRQLAHADHYGIPVAVILGEDEAARGEVSVKDLHAGKEQREDIEDHDAYRRAGKAAQVTVPRAELVETVKGMLG